MQHALRLSRGARGVEDEQRVLRAHLLRETLRGNLGHLLVEPRIAARGPWHVATGMPHHQHRLDVRALLKRGVGIGLERNFATTAQTFIGGNHNSRIAVLDAASKRVRREAAEHD